MVETFTPAVCGGRTQRRVALAAFGICATVAAAALGAMAGLAGRAVDRGAALGVVAILAIIAALREAEVVRLPVPQLRRQVPESWRRTAPPPLWAGGYGALLGAGVLTHQPVVTLWIALAGAVALGSPAAGALCLAVFGVARIAMVLLPARGRAPADGVARLVNGRRLLRPLNAGVLVAVALLVGAAPATAEPRGRLDPSLSGRTLAYAEVNGDQRQVVVRSGATTTAFPGGDSPALDGPFLAYADDQGIRVVVWRTGQEVARVSGTVDKPALDWPNIAFIRLTPSSRELRVGNVLAGRFRTIVRARRTDDLGRPALRSGRLAWHLALPRDSRLMLWNARLAGRPRLLAQSRTAVHVNPSLTAGHIAWVEQRAEDSKLRVLRTRGRSAPRTVLRWSGRNRLFWTTALSRTRAYVTAWNVRTGQARLLARAVRAP